MFKNVLEKSMFKTQWNLGTKIWLTDITSQKKSNINSEVVLMEAKDVQKSLSSLCFVILWPVLWRFNQKFEKLCILKKLYFFSFNILGVRICTLKRNLNLSFTFDQGNQLIDAYFNQTETNVSIPTSIKWEKLGGNTDMVRNK